MEHKTYHYDKDTKEYKQTTNSRLDPLETKLQDTEVYLLPDHATFVPVSEAGEKQVAVFDKANDSWTLEPDFRGVSVWDTKGDPVTITEIGPLPEGYTDEEPPLNYEKIRKSLERKVRVFRYNYIYGGVFVNNIPFGTNSNDVSWMEWGIGWLNRNMTKDKLTVDINTLDISSNGDGVFDNPLPKEVTEGSIVTLGPPLKFVVDEPSDRSYNGKGHFLYPIEDILFINMTVSTNIGNLVIANITKDTNGTDPSSVEFSSNKYIETGTYSVIPNSQFPERLTRIRDIDTDNSQHITLDTEFEIIPGIMHVRGIFKEPILNWQIPKEDGGFFTMQITYKVLNVIFNLIADFGQDCFTKQAEKLKEIYELPDDQLHTFEVEDGWPSKYLYFDTEENKINIVE